jgi:hypothetical protein
MSNNFRSLLPKTIKSAAVTVIALGILTNWIYDILFKPGVSYVSAILIDFVTLGSNTFRNAIYSSAAVDPTALPALIVMFAAVMSLPYVLGDLLSAIRSRRAKRRVTSAPRRNLTDAEISDLKNELDRKIRKIEWTGIIALSLCVISALTMATMISSAISVWRVFHANLTIVAPYVSEVDSKKLRAEFAKMKSSTDYENLNKKLDQIAVSNGTTLLEYRAP